MTKVLHITPHLGGGVGRVLSQVATYNATHNTGVREEFICLEPPEKMQFVDAMTRANIPVSIEPDVARVREKMTKADIVHLEWWQHPLMAKWLHDASGMTCRLVVWSHTSGLHYPAFPKGFSALPHVFMATTAASGMEVAVPSCGGFDDIPERTEWNTGAPRYGYIGSFNDAKLHPHIMEFLLAPGGDFCVQFYGDSSVATPLRPAKSVKLMGYIDQPASALMAMDVLVYLLNPQHYGTTENALLEAMAAGVVPIVMNNKVEMSIVRHGKTGFVVDSPAAFAEAIDFLEKNPEARMRMGKAAAADIRARFSLEETVNGLRAQYDAALKQLPKTFDFRALFGDTPFEWFIAGLGQYAPLFAPGAEISGRAARRTAPFLYEKNKSSLAHFLRYFPEDDTLNHWAGVLADDLVESRKNA